MKTIHYEIQMRWLAPSSNRVDWVLASSLEFRSLARARAVAKALCGVIRIVRITREVVK